ncbi:MAG TPA: alcohol dehydrogenase catalytic domain-containing protein [Chloroflexota bacterium]|nr:alcohol dehydrogenase catalytic domain-containing protein [Chloroflexota bacterium]
MRALRFDGTRLALADVPRPSPPPGEALVRVRLAGVCHTDLELTRGYMGFQGTLGHEFVGEVEAATPLPGGASPLAVGQRVVGEINAACGACTACRAGLGRHCPTRTVLGIQGRDGAFADYLALPLANLHPVPDAVPDEAAVFVEPLAAALEILEQVAIRPTDRVLVLGDGKLGQLVARVLATTGCDLTVVGHHAEKRALLAAASIAALAAPPDARADVVVDCTGRAAGFAEAMALVRPRGTLVLKSTVATRPGEPPLNLAPLVIDEITVVGSRCGPFAPALRALAEGRVTVQPLVTAEYPLADGVAAFARAAEPGMLKVLVRP